MILIQQLKSLNTLRAQAYSREFPFRPRALSMAYAAKYTVNK